MKKEEVEGLNRIKKLAYCHKEREFVLMRSTFGPINIIDNNENILNNLQYYINMNQNKFYGLSFEDIKQVYLALQNAKFNDNDKQTEFPDFILDNGFIEHFKVSSSNDNRKGMLKIIEDKKFNEKIAPEKNLFEKQCKENQEYNTTQSMQWQHEDVQHSYENFVKSFKKHFEKHINRIDEYQGNKNLKIFLIEYTDNGLEMIKEEYKNYDYFQKSTLDNTYHLWHYLLSKDKNMLNYLNNYRDKLDYIILDIEHEFEIIKLDKIKDIISNLKCDFAILGRKNIIKEQQIYKKLKI